MLDRTRCVVDRRLGTDPVVTATTFEEGDILHWSADGWAVSADGTDTTAIRGIAGINKQSALYGVIIDEEITLLGATVATNLAHSNLVADSQKVTSEDGLTTYTETTDYTCNDTNGTITSVLIPDGTDLLVSYMYQKTQAEYEEDPGLNINNSLDETLGSGNVVVWTGKMTIATTRYDTSKAYAVSGILYDNGDGRLTSTAGSNIAVGYCKVVPTASDPYMVAVLDV